MKYFDGFCVIETTDIENTGFYADVCNTYFEMPNSMVEYIVKRLRRYGIEAYNLLGYAKQITKNREWVLYNGK